MMQLLFRGGKAFVYFGIVMIVMGLLVFIFPKFFAYIFAGIVLLMGIFFVGIGLLAKPINPMDNPNNRDPEFTSYEEVED